MSEKDHEARIKQLEESVNVLKDSVRGLVDMHGEIIRKVFPSLSQTGLETTHLILLLREDINAIQRFIGSQEIFGDKETRQQMIDGVSRSESKFDALIKQVIDAIALGNKGMQNPPLPPASPIE